MGCNAVETGCTAAPDDAPQQELPLDGVTALDFSQFLAGPSAALRLADLGARVIKIERPGSGDGCRALTLADQRLDDDSILFHTINRNKESYAVDLKDAAARPRLEALIGRADILIHNFRPGVMERLGLGFEAVQRHNPGLIYAGVSGYGEDGPWRALPGQDLLVQAVSGITWLSGDASGPPVPVGLAITDMMAGAHLVQGILALLVRRGRTGRGGRVDVSLLETAVDLQFEQLSAYLNGDGDAPRRSAVSNGNIYLGAPYGLYATADGHLAIAMAPVDRVGELIGCRPLCEFPPESWFVERDGIKSLLARHLLTGSTQHWLDKLQPADIWCAPVLDWPALFGSGALDTLDPVQTVRTSSGATLRTTRCPVRIDGRVLTSARAAPGLGADTATIDSEATPGSAA